MNFTMAACGFIFLLSALGCTTSPKRDYTFIAIPESINNDPKKALSAEDVSYDISQTVYALETVYSGKKYLPNDEFKNLIQNLNTLKGPTTASELCERIDSYMAKVSDNHLEAQFNRKKCFTRATERKPSVGKNFYTSKNKIPWATKLEKRKNKTALLISILEFDKSSSPTWNGFLDSVKAKIPKADFVILDMRGNQGGDDTKGFELSTLLAGVELKTPYDKQWNNPSPDAQQIFVNTYTYWARLKKDEGKEVPAYLEDLIKKFSEKRDLAIKNPAGQKQFYEAPGGSAFDYEKSIKKPIYILVDANCASSCESTTDFFEFNPLVKTVGENTAGYVHFGNNGNVFLKNSGVALQMAFSYNSYTDGRFIEKIGIKPKIQVPPGQDAMESSWKDYLATQKNEKIDRL